MPNMESNSATPYASIYSPITTPSSLPYSSTFSNNSGFPFPGNTPSSLPVLAPLKDTTDKNGPTPLSPSGLYLSAYPIVVPRTFSSVNCLVKSSVTFYIAIGSPYPGYAPPRLP